MSNDLYTKVAEYYNITVLELRHRITRGEMLIHNYYMANK